MLRYFGYWNGNYIPFQSHDTVHLLHTSHMAHVLRGHSLPDWFPSGKVGKLPNTNRHELRSRIDRDLGGTAIKGSDLVVRFGSWRKTCPGHTKGLDEKVTGGLELDILVLLRESSGHPRTQSKKHHTKAFSNPAAVPPCLQIFTPGLIHHLTITNAWSYLAGTFFGARLAKTSRWLESMPARRSPALQTVTQIPIRKGGNETAH